MRSILISLVASSVLAVPFALHAQEKTAPIENFSPPSLDISNALNSVKKAVEDSLIFIKSLLTLMGNPEILREDQKTSIHTLIQWQKQGEEALASLNDPKFSLEEISTFVKQLTPDESIEKALSTIDEGAPAIAQKKHEAASSFQDLITFIGIFNDHVTLKNLHEAEDGSPAASQKLLIQLLHEIRETFSAFLKTISSPTPTTTEALNLFQTEVNRWDSTLKKPALEKRDLSSLESLDLYRTSSLDSALFVLERAGGNKEKYDSLTESIRHFFSFLEHHSSTKMKSDASAEAKNNDPDLKESHEKIVKNLSDIEDSLKEIEDKAKEDTFLSEDNQHALEHLRETVKNHQALVRDALKTRMFLSPLDAHILSGEGEGGDALRMALSFCPQEGDYGQLHQSLVAHYGELIENARHHSALHERLSVASK